MKFSQQVEWQVFNTLTRYGICMLTIVYNSPVFVNRENRYMVITCLTNDFIKASGLLWTNVSFEKSDL